MVLTRLQWYQGVGQHVTAGGQVHGCPQDVVVVLWH